MLHIAKIQLQNPVVPLPEVHKIYVLPPGMSYIVAPAHVHGSSLSRVLTRHIDQGTLRAEHKGVVPYAFVDMCCLTRFEDISCQPLILELDFGLVSVAVTRRGR